MDLVNPYVKNDQIWMCPSAPKNTVSYGAPCTGAVSHVRATYIWPNFNGFSGYNWRSGPNRSTSVLMFARYPRLDCTSSGLRLCQGPEQADFPAQAAFLNEGYNITYDVAGMPFGSACTIGYSDDWTDTKIFRHTGGSNTAMSDGHVKWISGQNFNTNSSETTTTGFPGNPESPFMKSR